MSAHQFVLAVPSGRRVCMLCEAAFGSVAASRPCTPHLSPATEACRPDLAHPKGLAERWRS